MNESVSDRGGSVARRFFRGALFLGLLLSAPSVFAACQQVTLYPSSFSSWTTNGYENQVRIEEHYGPDSLAGRTVSGPYTSQSDNVLGFSIPALTGTVVSAELRLQIRYLVSSRGRESYQFHAISNPRVKLNLHRRQGGDVFDDPNATIYGTTTVSITDPNPVVPLSQDFIQLITAAAGKTFLMEGSLNGLDGDPYNAAYLYLETYQTYATLVLTLSDGGPAKVVRQPLNAVTGEGTDVDFSVLACGAAPISYQWRFNGANVPGGTNSDLFLSHVSSNQVGSYSVVVGNSVGSSTSSLASLTIIRSAPYFAVQPSPPPAVVAGTSQSYLYAQASGAPSPTYQWRMNGTNIAGATNNLLRFNPAALSHSGTYSVVASNASGSVTSNPVLINVVPLVTCGPYFSGTFAFGGFLLGNAGTIYFYPCGPAPATEFQWYRDGAPIPGATNYGYSFVATYADAGFYSVIQANQYGSLTSSIGNITISAQAPTVQGPYDTTMIAGLPNQLHTVGLGGLPPVYFWFHDGVEIPNQNSSTLNFPSVSFSDAGQYSVIASNQLGMTVNAVPATVTVVAGQLYVNTLQSYAYAGAAATFQGYYEGVPQVSFQWYFNGQLLLDETNSIFVLPGVSSNAIGTYTLTASNVYGVLTSSTGITNVYESPATAYSLTRNTTNYEGDCVWLTGSFFGAPVPSCQWKFNGVDIPGATNFVLALSNVSTQHAGIYSVIISNGVFSPYSNSAASTFLAVIPAGSLDEWTPYNPKPEGNPLKAVAFGGNRRVAVGDSGEALVSINGQPWTARFLGKGVALHAITFGNGQFVAVGQADSGQYKVPAILTSPDGFTWAAHDVSVDSTLTAVAYGNGRYVALGAEDYFGYAAHVVLTSTDGVIWQKHYLRTVMSLAPLSGLCFGNGRFVAVADNAGSRPSIFSSTDGIDWATGSGTGTYDFEAVCAGPGQFVAVGDYGRIARSSDGLNWTAVGIVGNPALKAVAYGNGTYIAAGDNGVILFSGDGASWTAAVSPSVHDLAGATFDGTRFTTVGDAGRMPISTNGQSWTDECIGPDTDLYAITHGPHGFVAVGEGPILQSNDGTNWNAIASSKKLHAVAYGNGLYVAVGKTGTIRTSPDGLNWTTRSSPVSDYIEAVLWANNRFTAVGANGLIIYSTDGINWTKAPQAAVGDLEDVTYGNGLFVAVGGYFDQFGAVAEVVTSVNGINWTEQYSVLFFGVRVRGVTYGNGKFVLVGNDGLVASSINGSFWSEDFVEYENFRAVTYTSGRFVAVGNNGLMMSSLDGEHWNYQRSPTPINLRDAYVTDDSIFVVGSNGAIWKSGPLQPSLQGGLSGGGFMLHLRGGVASQYRLQRSSDLLNWSNVMTYSNSLPVDFFDAAPAPLRFFRTVPAP